jgi:hypothetical protein
VNNLKLIKVIDHIKTVKPVILNPESEGKKIRYLKIILLIFLLIYNKKRKEKSKVQGKSEREILLSFV